jgi:hypothetical protein
MFKRRPVRAFPSPAGVKVQLIASLARGYRGPRVF